MTDQNVTSPNWVPVGVAVGVVSLIVVALQLCIFILCGLYCSWCICCPCNRKRGQAQLTVTRKDQPSKKTGTIFKRGQQTSNGITMFVGPKTLLEHPSNTSLTPHTPSSASSSDTVSSRHLLLPSASIYVPNTERQSGCVSPTDSCSYVLPNNMVDFQVNDGSERSTSWQKYEGRISSIAPTQHTNQKPTSVYILSRSEAETALRAQGTIGCYVFRNTSDNHICLSALAVKGSSLVFRHLLLVETADGSIKIDSLSDESESFQSLAALEEHYWANEIHFQDGGQSLNLTMPCKCS